MPHTTSAPSSILQSHLIGDHLRFEALFESLVVAANAGDSARVQRTWEELVSSLRAHFDIEEKFLVPFLLEVSPVETRTVVQEHRHFRDRMDELTEHVRAGTARIELLRGFMDELYAHMKHEDAVLYTRVSLAPGELEEFFAAVQREKIEK